MGLFFDDDEDIAKEIYDKGLSTGSSLFFEDYENERLADEYNSQRGFWDSDISAYDAGRYNEIIDKNKYRWEYERLEEERQRQSELEYELMMEELEEEEEYYRQLEEEAWEREREEQKRRQEEERKKQKIAYFYDSMDEVLKETEWYLSFMKKSASEYKVEALDIDIEKGTRAFKSKLGNGLEYEIDHKSAIHVGGYRSNQSSVSGVPVFPFFFFVAISMLCLCLADEINFVFCITGAAIFIVGLKISDKTKSSYTWGPRISKEAEKCLNDYGKDSGRQFSKTRYVSKGDQFAYAFNVNNPDKLTDVVKNYYNKGYEAAENAIKKAKELKRLLGE